MSISAVSKHLKRLEDALSLKLLGRSNRTINPTETGLFFYQHCVRILAALELAKADALGISEEMSGLLRVHSTANVGTTFVAPATVDFAKAFSSLRVELSIGTLPVNPANRGLDVIVISGDASERDPKAHDSLVILKLGAVRYIVCASPEYLDRHGVPTKPEELQKRPCLVHLNAERNPYEWEFTEEGRTSPGSDQLPVSVNLRCAVLAGAVEGISIALLPEYTVRSELNAGRLRPFSPTPSDRKG